MLARRNRPVGDRWVGRCVTHRTWRRGMNQAPSVTAIVLLSLVSAVPPLLGQDPSVMRASRQLGDETALDVNVRYGAGTFTLSAAEAPRLYQVHLRYDEDVFRPVHDFEDGRLVVGIDGNGGRSAFRRGFSESGLDLTLSDQIPMDLQLEFGAVRADLDLGGLRLRVLELSTGASEAELRVSSANPEPMRSVRLAVGAASLHARELGRLNAEELTLEAGVGDVRLDFAGLRREETRIQAEIGVGNLEIRIPSHAGIRLTRQSFLTSLEAPELQRRGDAYFSSNWDASSVRVTIVVQAAFGKVSVLRSD